MKYKSMIWIVLIGLSISLNGCGFFTSQQPFTFDGTVTLVQYIQSYVIVADDGTGYVPTTILDPVYRVNGLRVKVTAVPSKSQNSFTQWGTLIDILDIQKLEP